MLTITMNITFMFSFYHYISFIITEVTVITFKVETTPY